uniref:NADH-ubiquinone oxidoreductase chain 5 n=1 Tax=Anaphothrips obscurus TaxID=864839 RepID=A0A343EQE0_9NEOP|nr:NADH dehydrogenase subunit 5 [Anaphothrips obscurus]ASJ63895.1 NADH dehydrogenase subunit 5 [Anaphothrips obscurus]
MKNLFLIMSFFFILNGIMFFFTSFIFLKSIFSLYMEWNLIFLNMKISFPLFLDFKSCLFMGLVFLISGSILIYCEYYMELEVYQVRFFFLMKFFIISMIFLILCPNFICMLIGWDGLGLVSFCLVIFYQNFKSLSSGILTALTNRLGDVFILASVFIFFFNGSWNYMNFINLLNQNLMVYLFMFAAMTKSAQIPFSAWLPAAMAAPTPVSSLVHSSTLVTAGVYILIRFFYILKDYSSAMNFLMIMGLLTMIMSGISGIFEFDLKKIIALSTLSQLGFMISTLSLNLPDLAFFHLLTHACFKALMFMCSGIFIHQFMENQDIRNFGLMNKNFSLSLCMFNIANFSLMGFPFLSGFFSKDLILEMMILKNLSIVHFFMFLIGTFLTVFYSVRLTIFLTFKVNFFSNSLLQNLNKLKIEKSMFLLFFFSIFLGFTFSKMFFYPLNYINMPLNLKVLILCICLLSFFLSLNFSFYFIMFKNFKIIMFFSMMWFLGFLKTDFFKKKIFLFGSFSYNSTEIFVENFFGSKNLNLLYIYSSSLSYILKKFIFLIFLLFFLMILWIIFMVF